MSGRQPLGELSASLGIGVRPIARSPDEIVRFIVDWTERAKRDFVDYVDFQQCLDTFWKYKNEEKQIDSLLTKLEDENVNPLYLNVSRSRRRLQAMRELVNNSLFSYAQERDQYGEHLQARLRREAAEFLQTWWRRRRYF